MCPGLHMSGEIHGHVCHIIVNTHSEHSDTFQIQCICYNKGLLPVITFCIIVWYGNMSLNNKTRLSNLVKGAVSISGRSRVQHVDLQAGAEEDDLCHVMFRPSSLMIFSCFPHVVSIKCLQ